jgi:enoyl-CoA hydratase/carnithine racemase
MYIKRDVQDGVGILSFNKPERHNAFDDEGQAEMLEAFTWAQKSKDFTVVLMRGEGRSFSSGRDTSKLGVRQPGVQHHEFLKEATRNIHALLDMGKPMIAAVKGATIGGAAEMAMMCDFRVSSTDLRFSLPEAKHGVCVDQGGSALVSSLIGPARAKYLLMTGDMLDAKTAYEWGLVDFLVAPEELDAKALEIAVRIARNPQRAVSAAKSLVDDIWSDVIRAAMRRELTTQLVLFGSEEFAELREKRQRQAAAKP